jgi:hypothetical protein
MAAMAYADECRRRSRSLWTTSVVTAVVAAWLAVVAVPPFALVAWRDQRLAELTTPETQQEWDAFRDDMRRQTGTTGPVQRKVPKSAEQPELVWLRDHLRLAIVAWITLVGVLGGFLAAITVGIARAASTPEDGPTGGRNHQKQNERDAQDADERRHD